MAIEEGGMEVILKALSIHINDTNVPEMCINGCVAFGFMLDGGRK